MLVKKTINLSLCVNVPFKKTVVTTLKELIRSISSLINKIILYIFPNKLVRVLFISYNK